MDLQQVANQAAAEACKPQDCFPHGICEQGRCRCVVAFAGKQCGHGVHLSWPFLPEEMKSFTTQYDLELIVHGGMRHKQLTVRVGLPGSGCCCRSCHGGGGGCGC